MKKTEIIGLTGGIGSGKSTAADCFREYGIPVLDADVIARAALEPETDCYRKTVALFGPACVLVDGTIDRRYVASRVFSNEPERAALNAIIHPFVLETMQRETERLGAECVVWEVPLLFESGFDAYCNRTVAVLCDESIRVDRVCRRDGLTEEQARSRVRAQMTDADREALADAAIRNEGDRAALAAAIETLLCEWGKRL